MKFAGAAVHQVERRGERAVFRCHGKSLLAAIRVVPWIGSLFSGRNNKFRFNQHQIDGDLFQQFRFLSSI
jgi:hypothetical protein